MDKKLLSICVAGAMAAPVASQAVKYKLSGQVNRAVTLLDDGVQSRVRHVDNIASGTRFRFKGSEDIGNGMKVGFYYESQWSSSRSNTQRPNMNSDGSSGSGGLRQANVWFSGHWGKLTLGQASGAGDGTTKNDQFAGGTGPTGAYHVRTEFTGGLRWRTSGGAGITSGGGTIDPGLVNSGADTTAGGLIESDTFKPYDAFSRHDVIRYDSPSLGPVKLAASIGNDSVWEIAARMDQDIGGGNLLFSAFYGEDGQGVRSDGTDERWGGSLNYTFSQGTSIAGAYASNTNNTGLDSNVFTVRIGHRWGNNGISAGYSQASDVISGFDDEGFNVGFIHSLPKAKTDLYASLFHTELDTPTGVPSVEDHNTFAVGARVSFN